MAFEPLYGLPRGRGVDLKSGGYPLSLHRPPIEHGPLDRAFLTRMERRRAASSSRACCLIASTTSRLLASGSSFIAPVLATVAVHPVQLGSNGPAVQRQLPAGIGLWRIARLLRSCRVPIPPMGTLHRRSPVRLREGWRRVVNLALVRLVSAAIAKM